MAKSALRKRLAKQTKKLTKVCLRITGVFADEIGSYKKTLLVGGLVLIFGLLFTFGSGMISGTMAKYIVMSESEILRRVGTHTALPTTPPTSIVRVKDAEALRAQHMFYKDVKEGDYIIIYNNRVIIYDLRADAVIGEKSSQ